VIAKAEAASVWCQHASHHARESSGKSWTYLLIPHDQIAEQMTLAGLAARYTYQPRDTGATSF
jgi:type III restriction enzyme